jgi:hypothetical protein
VVPVAQDLRLDDRDDAVLLAEGGVASERVTVRPGRVRRDRADVEDRTPLRERGPAFGVRREPVTQAVQPLRDEGSAAAGQEARAGVDLDAGKDAQLARGLGERSAVRELLPERLVRTRSRR